MKKISLLLTALFSLGLSQGYAQALKTVRTYYDLFSTTEPSTASTANTVLPTARPPTKASPASRPTTSTTSCTDTIWST